jgi:hypothetical protein
MPFKPTDFTQVNPHINRVLVSRALRLLDVQRSERVIDWFCGLGNFTLPLATLARARCWALRAARHWWRVHARTTHATRRSAAAWRPRGLWRATCSR